MNIHRVKNLDELSHAAADFIVEHIKETLATKNKYTIALSGGNTPKNFTNYLHLKHIKNKN